MPLTIHTDFAPAFLSAYLYPEDLFKVSIDKGAELRGHYDRPLSQPFISYPKAVLLLSHL